MSTVNIKKSATEASILIFDSFYKREVKVDVNEFDLVRAYFLDLYQNPDIADDFTAVIFQIATGYQKSALDILEEMKGQDGVSVNATICYYLNGLRSKATMLGVTNVQQPNIYAARNILV